MLIAGQPKHGQISNMLQSICQGTCVIWQLRLGSHWCDQTLHAICPALLCTSHAMYVPCKFSHTVCVAEFTSHLDQNVQDPFFFFFPPHLCDPIPVQVHTAFCGDVIMFTLTHAVVQRAVWTACEWDAMWEPTLHQSEPSLSVNSIIQGWTATSKPYKSCKFLPVEAHTCAPPL